MQIKRAAVASAIISTVFAKNILLTNDDSSFATNIHAAYRELANEGHNVIMVAPASQRSGWGGRFVIPNGNKLETDTEFGAFKAGDNAWGSLDNDPQMWYFNGTPAACVAFGLDYVIPNHFNNLTVDLVVGGPNEGTNLGPRDFVISGTIGSAYYAVERGIPAIAFSGSNGTNSYYKESLNDDATQSPTIYAKQVVKLVQALFEKQGDGARTLPLSVGLNVNFPVAGTDMQSDCMEPAYVHTRMTGSKEAVYALDFSEDTESFRSYRMVTEAVGNCVNGDCTLAGETDIVGSGCYSTISAFSIDADLPEELGAETAVLFQALL